MPGEVRVSLNKHVDQVLKEEEKYEKQGFLVVGDYKSENDFGHIMEWANGENRQDVLYRHYEYDYQSALLG